MKVEKCCMSVNAQTGNHFPLYYLSVKNTEMASREHGTGSEVMFDHTEKAPRSNPRSIRRNKFNRERARASITSSASYF